MSIYNYHILSSQTPEMKFYFCQIDRNETKTAMSFI